MTFDELLIRIPEIEVSDNARAAHLAVIEFLRMNGYTVTPEYEVADRGDSKPGHVDIYASDGTTTVAFEIDSRRPRKKSIFKLKQVDALRVIVLRNPSDKYTIPVGVDAVIGLICS